MSGPFHPPPNLVSVPLCVTRAAMVRVGFGGVGVCVCVVNSTNRVRMTANETLCMLCLREGEDGNAATVATAAVREAQGSTIPGGNSNGNSEHELPVRAYTLASLVHCVTSEGGGDGLTAADTVSQMAGAAMQQWDAAAGGECVQPRQAIASLDSCVYVCECGKTARGLRRRWRGTISTAKDTRP